jgi:hypothetical protein
LFISKGNNSLIQGKCIVFALCFFILCLFPFDSVFVSLFVVAIVGKNVQLKLLGGFHFVSFCSRHSSLYVLALGASCSMSFCFWHSLLCVLALCAFALGAPHFLCPCSKRSLLCELLLSALFNLCYVLGTLHSLCSCFGHFSLCVFLFLVLPIAFESYSWELHCLWLNCY